MISVSETFAYPARRRSRWYVGGTILDRVVAGVAWMKYLRERERERKEYRVE